MDVTGQTLCTTLSDPLIRSWVEGIPRTEFAQQRYEPFPITAIRMPDIRVWPCFENFYI